MVNVKEAFGKKILWAASIFDLVVEVRGTGFSREFDYGMG